MMNLSESVPLAYDIDAGGGAVVDLYFDPMLGHLIEVKSTCDGILRYVDIPIDEAIDGLTDEQVTAVAEIILRSGSRGSGKGKIRRSRELAFEKLVAEMHYEVREIREIKEAIGDYYG